MSEPDGADSEASPAPQPPEPEPQTPSFEPDYSLIEYFKKSDDPSDVEYR